MSTHHGILLHVVFSTKFRFKCISENWSDAQGQLVPLDQ